MTERSGPFDTTAWTESDWALASRLWLPDSVNNCAVSTPGGLVSAVAAGEAWVRGFGYSNDASKNLNHVSSTGTAGQSRNDLAVLHLDRAANTIDARLIAGAFAVTPSDPALTRTDGPSGIWEVPLARINIPANAVNVGTITDLRPLRAPDGTAVRPPGTIRLTRIAAVTAFAGATSTLIPFDSATYDYNTYPSSVWNTATSVFTAPSDGLYEFYVKITGTLAATGSEVWVQLNDASTGILAMIDRYTWRGTSGDRVGVRGMDRIQLAAGAVVRPFWTSNSAGNFTPDLGPANTFMHIRKLG